MSLIPLKKSYKNAFLYLKKNIRVMLYVKLLYKQYFKI